ncbi:MAG: transporter substrate-binding protein [Marmoricola sp.]|nr:transporter substrate-binding protein [Marmoricola sp.]
MSGTWIKRLSTVLAVVLVALIAITVLRPDGDRHHLTATFARTTSLYAGAKVKVLGVPVGKVDSIKVKGTAVEVRISYDDDVELPADVHAMIVPPSIVGDRFVQLAPAYLSGPTLADGARLGEDRTGVPLELDDTYKSLDQLASALGPKGANTTGALSRFVSAAAANLDGNGRQLNDTLRQFASAVGTLAGSSDDISGTVTNLSEISQTFAGKDAEVRALVTALARVGTELNSQRTELTSSVTDLRSALGTVATFTRKHRAALKSSIAGLDSVTDNLAGHADELGRLTSLAPVGLTSLMNIYVGKNWDPTRPDLTPVDGRTGGQALRAPLFEDLDIQLSSVLSGVCEKVNPTQQVQISAFCTALSGAGGSLGSVLTSLVAKGSPVPLDPSPKTLAAMLGGQR